MQLKHLNISVAKIKNKRKTRFTDGGSSMGLPRARARNSQQSPLPPGHSDSVSLSSWKLLVASLLCSKPLSGKDPVGNGG